ncbi:hypothetical protein MTO96_019166 [Rhipicephalus appendiculatus]
MQNLNPCSAALTTSAFRESVRQYAPLPTGADPGGKPLEIYQRMQIIHQDGARHRRREDECHRHDRSSRDPLGGVIRHARFPDYVMNFSRERRYTRRQARTPRTTRCGLGSS